MYLGFPEDAGEPPKQLKGFKKVMLAPGASATVDFPLDERSTAIWDVTRCDPPPQKKNKKIGGFLLALFSS